MGSMNLLYQYIIACTNLYGLVPITKVLEIYNQQNDQNMPFVEYYRFLEAHKKELEEEMVTIHVEHFVYETIWDSGEFETVINAKIGKPMYIPPKDELLKYTDALYFEKNEQYNAVYDYALKNFFDGDADKTATLCRELYTTSMANYRFRQIYSDLKRHGAVYEDVWNMKKEFEPLISQLADSARLWENNGFTAKELRE